MPDSESRPPNNTNPFEASVTKPAGQLPPTVTQHRTKWSRGWFVMFAIVGLLSLIPPLTYISLGCMVLGGLFLVIAEKTKHADPNVDHTNRTVAVALLMFPGLVLTSAVMFAGTCNSIVWPVVWYNAYPAVFQPDLIIKVPGPHLVVGMIAGVVMAMIWCVWFVKGDKRANDPEAKSK